MRRSHVNVRWEYSNKQKCETISSRPPQPWNQETYTAQNFSASADHHQ
jgi:hypothetical protein